jgi:hypothetical protein
MKKSFLDEEAKNIAVDSDSFPKTAESLSPAAKATAALPRRDAARMHEKGSAAYCADPATASFKRLKA